MAGKKDDKPQETLPATKEEAGLPTVINFEEDAGAGFEDADASCFAIPFMRMLQSGSPQCKKMDPAYIKGAEEGDMINTVTGELYKGEHGVMIIPVHLIHKYNLWAPKRGGFKGSLSPAEYATAAKHKETIQSEQGPREVEVHTASGNIITDTREHYVLICQPNGTTVPALVSLASTQLKRSKKWSTLMDGIKLASGKTAPMFSQIYMITPEAESNDSGSWVSYHIEHVKEVTNPNAYAAAKKLQSMIRTGAVTTSAPGGDEDTPF